MVAVSISISPSMSLMLALVLSADPAAVKSSVLVADDHFTTVSFHHRNNVTSLLCHCTMSLALLTGPGMSQKGLTPRHTRAGCSFGCHSKARQSLTLHVRLEIAQKCDNNYNDDKERQVHFIHPHTDRQTYEHTHSEISSEE